MGGGEGFEHPPMRCAADADLCGVVIAPQSGVFCTERAVTVIHIIGLARDREAHSPAVAGAAKPHHRSAHPRSRFGLVLSRESAVNAAAVAWLVIAKRIASISLSPSRRNSLGILTPPMSFGTLNFTFLSAAFAFAAFLLLPAILGSLRMV
jgi:hypothetical protein